MPGRDNKRTQEDEQRLLRPFHAGRAIPSCDVAVIGGGIIGSSVAYWLTRLNLKVTLLEAGEIGGGASGACDGFLSVQSKEPGPLMQMARASLRLIQDLHESLGPDLEYEACGGMLLARKGKDLQLLEQLIERASAHAVHVRLLDPSAARALEPALHPDIVGATLCEMEAEVNPLGLTRALARAAARQGAAIIEHCPAGHLAQVDGSWVIRTPRGVLRVPRLVCCAGAWSANVCEPLGISIPVTPLKGQILVTETTGPIISRILAGAEYVTSKHAEASVPGHHQPISGFTAEQTRSGNLLLGSTREESGFDVSTTPQAVREIVAHARAYLPALERLHIIRSFAGLRPQSRDGLPLLGEVAGFPGFYLATGHGGDGIALSLRSGQLLASSFAGDAVSDELAPFSPSRFPEFG